ncbi:recombinase family protein [Brucellaceae bacterium D45D]
MLKIVQILKKRQRKNEVKYNSHLENSGDYFRSSSRKIGYARVSTQEQKLDLQINALSQAGCEKIFIDEGVSGTKADREGLKEAIRTLKRGDMLIVWRLDRLGRSLINLVELVEGLGQQGVEFRSLTENIDTSSSGGRLVFHMMAALAEFERSLISERTRAGMQAAKLKGKHVGRPRRVRNAEYGDVAVPSK